MMNATSQLTNPEFFSRLDSIELRVHGIVEGFMQGLHRSPFVGYSVEFATHRKYVAGDDLRHVNWKLYARQKKLYVKEFDAETNLNVYLILDTSESMACANTGMSKRDYGASLAGAFAHLALKQRDAVGLSMIADKLVNHLEPKAKRNQLEDIMTAIVSTPTTATTNIGPALMQAALQAKHRGLVVVISDLFGNTQDLVRGLDQLRYRKHEVLLFHVWDLWERRLPLTGQVRFKDLETGETIATNVDGIREAYQKRVDRWCKEIDDICLSRGIERIEVTTDQPMDQALMNFLVHRTRLFS